MPKFGTVRLVEPLRGLADWQQQPMAPVMTLKSASIILEELARIQSTTSCCRPPPEGRLLASLIPNCRFVQLDGENHMPLANDPEWLRLVTEVRAFLNQPADRAPAHNALPLRELTPRERAVLDRIAAGLDNSQIAASLGLSEKTVRNHITRVFDKIGVEHRYQAIVLAREAGLGVSSSATSRS
jgi:DNA-binding CsgD family transcriptional regulator